MAEPAIDNRYAAWIGRQEILHDAVEPGAVRRMLATLDDVDAKLAPGDPVPPLWHWLAFLPEAPESALGADGHPEGVDIRPPIDLPRRMFAGADFRFHAPMPIGAPLRRVATVAAVQEKQGRSGRLVFMTVRHQVFHGQELCVEEAIHSVHRDLAAPTAEPGAVAALAPLPPGAWSRTIVTDPVLLFRFSALTFNGHRIHYDRPYATGVEGYAGLLVHGPLVAVLLIDLVRRNAPQRRVQSYQFRASAPIFDTAPFRVIGVPSADGRVALTAERGDGVAAMTGEVQLI